MFICDTDEKSFINDESQLWQRCWQLWKLLLLNAYLWIARVINKTFLDFHKHIRDYCLLAGNASKDGTARDVATGIWANGPLCCPL